MSVRARRATARQGAVFVDRAEVFAAVDAQLARLQQQCVRGWEAFDNDHRANENVLVVHGMQGVGKSALSREIAAELGRGSGGRLPSASGRVAIARVELDRLEDASLEAVLLHIRAALGAIQRRWLGFDVAFGVQWNRRHPGLPLKAHTTGASGFADDFDVAGAMEESFKEVVTSHWAAKLARGLGTVAFGKVIEGVHRKRLEQRYPDFLRYLTSTGDPVEWDELGELLARDLAGAQQMRVPEETAQLVVLLDGWEAIQVPSRRAIEEGLAWLAYQMPNALFLISGVRPLGWAAPDPEPPGLEISGPEHWPQLAPDAPSLAQLKLDPLEDDHAGELLDRVVAGAARPITDEVRRFLLDAADGLPEHLRLSGYRYTALAAQREAVVDDFPDSYPSLVQQVFDDLSPVEQDLLRCAALLPAFDAQTLRPGVPQATHGDVERFLELPFVEVEADRRPAASLHRALRSCVRNGQASAHRWAEPDWRDAATRLLDGLGVQATEILADPEVQSATREAGLFLLATELLDEASVLPSWLIALGDRLGRFARWDTFVLLRSEDEKSGSLRAAVADGFLGEMARVRSTATEGVELLSRALDHPEVRASGAASGAVGIRLSSALQDAGRFTDAQPVSEAVAQRGVDGFTQEALRQLTWLDLAGGRLADAERKLSAMLDAADQLSRDRIQRGATLNMLARIDEARGDLGRAVARKAEALELGWESSDAGGRARLLCHLGAAACFTGGDAALQGCEDGLLLELESGQSRQLPRLRAARAVLLARLGLLGAAEELELAVVDAQRIGSRWSELDVRFAELVVLSVGGVPATEAQPALDRFAALVDEIGAFAWYLPIARALWNADAEDASGTDWGITSWPEVRARWRAVAGR